MKSLMATMVAVAMATPAAAQSPNSGIGGGQSMGPNMLGEYSKLKTDVEIQQEKDRERAYKSGISKIPDAKGKVDPWGTVRGTATPQPAQNPQRPASR
jgi:hypothetical protein